MGLSIIRLDLDRAAQTLDGIVMAPLSDCKHTQIKMDFGIARIDGQCSLVALHCFAGAAKAVEYIGHRHECICKVRPDADRLLEVAQRKLEFAGSTIQVAQIEVSCRIVRITGYGKLVCAASLIEPGAREKNITAVKVCSRALRIGLDRRFIKRHCLRNPALFFQRISFIDHRDCGIHRHKGLGVASLRGC